MSDHATLSPSKRHRWAACPGSVREERAYPEDRSGPAAIDGTHKYDVVLLQSHLSTISQELIPLV